MNTEVKRWLVWSLKHGAWWGPNQAKYFTAKTLAGRYSFAEASDIVRRSNSHGQDIPSSAMIEDTNE